ncbi:calmodulin-like protein 5 [Lathyrus oleraceus]|uniref:EF-hand domain-containing protein n=1 Tax=Pisum sativum TaxID=3888 RepID=A0A9D5A3Q6_PEA|nr:calmodulin-like protein 5 [Pisum sativum]KAI5393143.1 hypothetical protein KIW84_060327 [Pisum sativum]
MYRAYKSVHPYYEKPKFMPQDKLDAGNKIVKMLEEADMNKDGRLTRDEIEKALKGLGSYFPGWKANRCLKKLDANNDGQISGGEIDDLVDYLLNHGYGKK